MNKNPITIKQILTLKKIIIFISLWVFTSNAHATDLKILHINDHHSHLKPDSRMSLTLDGISTRVRSGGMAAVVAKFKELSDKSNNVLKLHAGDAISGSLFYTLFKGEADAALMNEICFDAYAPGNHDFNEGDSGLARFIDFLASGECNTSILAANIKPKIGVSALAQQSETDYLKPYLISEKGGTKFGIIGIDIVRKTVLSSSPDETTVFLDEAETAQKMIDELSSQGINHIILLTHYGYENELELAKTLDGVDIIIGGDSHTLLGEFQDIGLNAEGPYPTVVRGSNGNNVCVATAWQYSQIVGELDVEFNSLGEVEECSGIPHLMLADTFKRKDSSGERVEVEGSERQAIYDYINKNPKLSLVKEDAGAKSLINKYNADVDVLLSTKIGTVKENLCLARIPGDARSKICSPAESQMHGSDISMVVAHAFREMAKTSDIAIQNGGGVRTDISAGDLTMGDAYKLLPFANTLVEMDMTGKEIKQVLEEAIEYALQPDGSDGAYPYAAGLRWNVDLTKSAGDRLSNLEFKGPSNNKWLKLNLENTYRLVTNNYIAAGRDGYNTFKSVKNDGRYLDTYLDYAQSFVDYVIDRGTIEKLPVSEYSTQSIVK